MERERVFEGGGEPWRRRQVGGGGEAVAVAAGSVEMVRDTCAVGFASSSAAERETPARSDMVKGDETWAQRFRPINS